MKQIYAFLAAVCCCAAITTSCIVPSNLHDAKVAVVHYYEDGQYASDTAAKMKEAAQYLPPQGAYNTVGMAVVFDLDDTCLSTYEYQKSMGFGATSKTWHEWIQLAHGTPIRPVLDFYNQVRGRGIQIFIISGRREKYRAVTEENLKKAGFSGWKTLYMKPDDFPKGKSVAQMKTEYRAQIQAHGYKIILNIGDQKEDLDGGFAEHTVLLPNLIYKTN